MKTRLFERFFKILENIAKFHKFGDCTSLFVIGLECTYTDYSEQLIYKGETDPVVVF